MSSETMKILKQLGVIKGGTRFPKWGLIIMFPIAVFIAAKDYFTTKSLSEQGKLSPFSEGLFKNEISGRIGNIKTNHNQAIIFLHYNGFRNNKEIAFYPENYDENGDYLSFFKTVQSGDSLWKDTQSNIVYTIGSDSIRRAWSFSTIDRYGRNYAN